MNSRERLLNTFKGKELDRIATYDIIHNVPLIEYLSGGKFNSKNAEDALCLAVSKVLDLVRHFSIPDVLELKVEKDEDGFIRKIEWWTTHLLERPFKSMADVIKLQRVPPSIICLKDMVLIGGHTFIMMSLN